MRHRIALCAIIALGMLPAHAFGQEKKLTIVVPDSIDNLDPCRMARNDVGRVLKQNIIETLTELSPETGEVMPRLATKWEQIDKNTWRFHLREGVKFHDGAAFNAGAVKVAVKRTLNEAMDCTSRVKYFGGVSLEVVPVDDLTLDFKTNPSQPILPAMLTNMPITAPSTPDGQDTNQPIGTGPFFLKAWKSGQAAELAAFADYWGDKPQVELATFVSRPDSVVQAAMVERGEADLAPYISVQDATNPATDFSYLNTETAQAALTWEKPPLSDVRVRKALNLAIDRAAFIGSIFSKDVQVASQIVLPTINGYNPEIEPWPYDPEQAKQLLAEAKADGIPVDSELILYGRPGFLPNQTEVLEALAQMWQQVGFNIKIQILEKAQFIDVSSKPHDVDRPSAIIFNLADNSTGDALPTLYIKYHGKGAFGQNPDAELDALLDAGMEAVGDERKNYFQKAFYRLTKELVADVILWHFVGYARIGHRIQYAPNMLTNNEIHIEDITFK